MLLNSCMRFFEFSTQTKTPGQLRIDSLKAAKDRASQSLQAERKRQQVAKAQQKLVAAQTAVKPINLATAQG